MKKICFLFLLQFLIFNLPSSFSQVGEWMWVSGSNTPGAAGTSGTKGVPSANNEPGAMYEPAEWADKQGNLWFYGGLNASYYPSDVLWKYDPIASEWTWMTGADTPYDPGHYGVQGVPSASNAPPTKSWGAASWVDLDGNFWLFGGYGGGSGNDLWKYDVSANLWTWMKGPSSGIWTGTYGTQGVPDTANVPGTRTECASAWTDNAGDLWLFGGFNGTGTGTYSDLWRFNIATNNWTWMKGPSTASQSAVYGTKGVEAPANNPSGRYAYAHWKDNNGNLWLFGGTYANTTCYNDLWRFNPATNNWTWMSGSDSANVGAVFGTKCVASSTNSPGQRYENRAAWTDKNGNFWMFGGGIGESFTEVMNDLWMYCVQSNQWTWEGGDSIYNPAGVWGAKGVANSANRPDGRAGSVAWSDDNGHLYMFGGSGNWFNPYNDLWMFTIDSSCGTCGAIMVPPVALFQAIDTILCENDCINYTDQSTHATSWQWSFAGGSPLSSTAQNPQVCYLKSGIYNVTLVASNSAGSDTLTINNYITVIAAPPTPSIQDHPGIGNDTLFFTTQPGYTSYQWLLDSTLIPNATDTFLIVFKSGNYNVQVTGANGCKIAAGIQITVGLQNYMSDHVISLSPNPADKSLQLAVGSPQFVNHELQIIIYNVLGEVVLRSPLLWRGARGEVSVVTLPSGIYFVQLIGEKERWVGRFVKE